MGFVPRTVGGRRKPPAKDTIKAPLIVPKMLDLTLFINSGETLHMLQESSSSINSALCPRPRLPREVQEHPRQAIARHCSPR